MATVIASVARRNHSMATVICPGPPGNLSRDRKEVIMREVVQGHQLANQLKDLLQRSRKSDASFYSAFEGIVMKIHASFTHSISLLASGESDDEACENLPISGAENTSPPAAASSDDQRSEDSNESRKRPLATRSKRRGCYKRRKTAQAWTTIEPTIEDGHPWRKYGQKEILHSKYPRSYFRCTRKYDQGCRATKQVQRMEENPDMYQITYIGVHTCRQNSKTPQMITSSDCEPWESFLNNICHEKYDEHSQDFPSKLLSVPTLQQECPKQETPTIIDFAADSLSLLDSCLWPDDEFKDNLNELSETSTAAIMFPKMESDHINGDSLQYSCADNVSPGIFGMDLEVDSVHFDDTHFHFDEDDQFLTGRGNQVTCN